MEISNKNSLKYILCPLIPPNFRGIKMDLSGK